MNREDGIVTVNESTNKPLDTKVLLSCLRNGNGSNSNTVGKNTRVSFPDDERDLVTAYLEPVNPWDIGPVSTEDLVDLYKESCQKHGTTPLEHVIEQLKTCCHNMELSGPLDLASLEALETIFGRIRFQSLRIKSLELNDDAAVALFDMLEYYECACKLSITCDKGLGPRGWQACSRLISKAHFLEELEVKGTPLNERVMVVLCKSLKVASRLSSLKLTRCRLSGRFFVILMEALKFNTSVQALTVADNALNTNDAIQLAALLRTNFSLRYLDISNNAIGDSGCASLCNVLMYQKKEGLEALILWNTSLTKNCGVSLSLLISQSTSLETLNIGQNNIGAAGLAAMKVAMIWNRSLRQLGLQSAEIDCEGLAILAEILTKNPELRRIDARNNEIRAKGLTALKTALAGGSGVHRIDLDDSTECQELIEEIREMCRVNEAKAVVEEEKETSRGFSFSRKISLTCETLMMRSHIEANNNFLGEPKRAGRLRSPEPSPIPSPASSPLPSPSRHRFRVSRVSESSPDCSTLSPSPLGSSRFRVTVVEPSTVRSEVNTQKVGGFESSPSNPPRTENEQRSMSPSPESRGTPGEPEEASKGGEETRRKVSKAQTSLEKLVGLFQNPDGLFSSFSISGDKQKNSVDGKGYDESDGSYDRENREFWEWDWIPIAGAKKEGARAGGGAADETCSVVGESHSENHNI